MSLFIPLLPFQASLILERAREDRKLTKQEFAHELGYEFSEYSKALHRVRPFDLNRVTEKASDEAQLAIAEAWATELRGRLQKDLVADLISQSRELIAQVDRLLSAKPRQAKADLVDVARGQEVA